MYIQQFVYPSVCPSIHLSVDTFPSLLCVPLHHQSICLLVLRMSIFPVYLSIYAMLPFLSTCLFNCLSHVYLFGIITKILQFTFALKNFLVHSFKLRTDLIKSFPLY